MKTKKMSKATLTRRMVEVENILAALADYKKLYARLDELTAELRGQDLSGYGFSVVDNFAEKNVVWKAAGIRRFEIKKVG